MNGYTITAAGLGSWGLKLGVVVVCLFLVGCESLWLTVYRAKGGYGKEPSAEEWRELQRQLNRHDIQP
jgi:hypothetical protein